MFESFCPKMAIEFWVRVSFARIHGCFCTFSGISSFAQNRWPKIPNRFYSNFCAFSAKCVCFTRRLSSQAINENIYWANTKTNKLHFCKKMNKKQYLFAIYLYLFIQFSQFRIRFSTFDVVVVVAVIWFFLFASKMEASKKHWILSKRPNEFTQ